MGKFFPNHAEIEGQEKTLPCFETERLAFGGTHFCSRSTLVSFLTLLLCLWPFFFGRGLLLSLGFGLGLRVTEKSLMRLKRVPATQPLPDPTASSCVKRNMKVPANELGSWSPMNGNRQRHTDANRDAQRTGSDPNGLGSCEPTPDTLI